MSFIGELIKKDIKDAIESEEEYTEDDLIDPSDVMDGKIKDKLGDPEFITSSSSVWIPKGNDPPFSENRALVILESKGFIWDYLKYGDIDVYIFVRDPKALKKAIIVYKKKEEARRKLLMEVKSNECD